MIREVKDRVMKEIMKKVAKDSLAIKMSGSWDEFQQKSNVHLVSLFA